MQLKLVVIGIVVCWLPHGLEAADVFTLRQELLLLLESHHLLKAAEADIQGARAGVGVARSGWYPKVSLGAQAGQEVYERKTSNVNTDLSIHQEGVSVSQLVWDFGATHATIDKAGETLRQSEAKQEAQRQDLILEGVGAYLNLWLAGQVLQLAEGLVANMARQTELERMRIEFGQGNAADLVHVQSQWEGAKARQVEARGDLREATHRYQAVFGEHDVAPGRLEPLAVPVEHLPHDLAGVIEAASTHHPSLLMARHAQSGARHEVVRVRAEEWFPRVDLVGDAKHYHNVEGTPGDWESRSVQLQANWVFDLGFKAGHAVESAEMHARALDERTADLENQLREKARNAWSSLLATREQAAHLSQQVILAEKFLTLARKEHELGRRSLLDVLNGETLLFTARRESITTTAKAAMAGYRVLHGMGRLDLTAVP